MTPRRGEIHAASVPGRAFLVISIEHLNTAGTCIVVEVGHDEFGGVRTMLAVPLADHDPLSGQFVLCWRLNWMRAERLGELIGEVRADTLDRVLSTVKAAIEP